MQRRAINSRDGHLSLPTATPARKVWLRVGTLIDGESDRPRRDAHIVYTSDSFLHVSSEGEPPPRKVLNAGQTHPDAELPGFTLLPCLVDSHAHLFLEGGALDPGQRSSNFRAPRGLMLASAKGRLEKLIRFGIAGVRDAGDKMKIGLALSKIAPSRRGGHLPYIDSPGSAIFHSGEYGGFMGDAVENFRSRRECIAARVHDGAARIKLIVSDVIDFRTGIVMRPPQMSAAEVREFSALARSKKMQTFAHASGDLGIQNAVTGGVDTVEHGFFVRDDQLARMRDVGIALVPTLSPLRQQIRHSRTLGLDGKATSNLRRILEGHSNALLKARRMGVMLLAGSDAGAPGVLHGVGLIEELCLMEAAGLPAMEVLKSGTGNPNHRLEFSESFGVVKPGSRSRFILTRHSPLRKIANLHKPKFIVFDGDFLATEEGAETSGL
ncbi:MAG TPA: amidohydrolase family protein [Bacteroidota bacterium]|nr:amidohydrolase family protein [Bacteroidota bacterium]